MALLALQFLFVTAVVVLWGTGLRDCLFSIFCDLPLSVLRTNNHSALRELEDHTQVCIGTICGFSGDPT